MAYQLIEGLKAIIVKSCPGTEQETREAIKHWETDEEARSRYESAVFAMCNEARKGIEET